MPPDWPYALPKTAGSSSVGDQNLTAPDDIPGTMTVILTQYKRATLELLIAAMRWVRAGVTELKYVELEPVYQIISAPGWSLRV